NPLEKTVLFDYQPTRGAVGAGNLLKGFRGYLQTDGYATYTKLGRQEGVTHLACWAHARREYFNALSEDRKNAGTALEYIQELYAVERESRENGLTPEERKKLRLDWSLPVVNRMSDWIKGQLPTFCQKAPWERRCATVPQGGRNCPTTFMTAGWP